MKELTIFLKRIFWLALILIVVDVLLGQAIKYLFNKQKSGKYFITSYALSKAKEDVLIFGDSHAAEHFDAHLMQDSLKTSVFNLGVAGQSLVFYYPLIKSVLSYHKPKLVILNLDATELVYNVADYQKMSIFLPYYGENKFVDSSINLIGDKEKFLALSSLFRYNSTIGYVLLNTSAKTYNKSYKSLGFDPQQGDICKNKLVADVDSKINAKGKVKFDPLKLKYLVSLIQYLHAQNVQLVITTTPLFNGMEDDNVYRLKLQGLLKANGVQYWDYANNTGFKGNCNLFSDPSHLNKTGADLFTNMISTQIIKSQILGGPLK